MVKVFISYSSRDKEWVRQWLLPQLETAGVQVVIDFRDFMAGTPILDNIQKAIQTCDKTILVLTPNWLTSSWAKAEGLMLQTKDPNGATGSIVPLMLETCTLPNYLAIFTHVDFRDKTQWDNELARLLNQWKTQPPPTPAPMDRAPIKIHLSHLPTSGPLFLGREKELVLLDDAWHNPLYPLQKKEQKKGN